jgi:predicted dehydrogenase
MIHDLDLALALNHAPLKQVEANGVKVLSDKIDIANARLVFRNGCVANLTASRISDKSMRKLRVFTRDAYFSVDFLQPEATIYRRQISGRNLKNLMANVKLSQLSLQELMTQQIYQVQRPQLSQDEPLRLELASFMDCVRTGQRPLVSGEDGYKALALAHQILKKL